MQLITHFCGVIKSEGARAAGAEKGKPGMHGSPAHPLTLKKKNHFPLTPPSPRAPAFRSTVPSGTTASTFARSLIPGGGRWERVGGERKTRYARVACSPAHLEKKKEKTHTLL